MYPWLGHSAAARIIVDGSVILFDAALKSLLVLALAVAIILLRRRASAATKHLIWSLAVCCSLLMPLLSVTLPAWHILPGWTDVAPVAHRPAPELVDALAPDPPFSDGVARAMPTPQPPPVPAYVEPSTPRPAGGAVPPSSIYEEPSLISANIATEQTGQPTAATRTALPAGAARGALVALWLAGILVLIGRLLLGFWCLRRSQRAACPITDPSWTGLMRRSAEQLGLRRPVILLQSHRHTMPMTWGVTRPRLLLPRDAEAWSARRRQVVLLHELAHIQRWDCLTQWLAQLACAIYWPNPLVWLARRCMIAAQEQACDNLVLARTSSAAEYAEHLVQIAARLQLGRLNSAAAIGMARPVNLEERLRALLDRRRSRTDLTRALVMPLALAFVVVLIPLSMMRAGTTAGPDKDGASNGDAIAAPATGTDEPLTVTGIVTTADGYPRANVYFSSHIPDDIYRGPQSDRDGRFVLKDVPPQQTHWAAFSQAMDKMAVFRVPREAGQPLTVKLSLNAGNVEGLVVDKAGHPCPKRKVEVGVLAPDGEEYPLTPRQTDEHGYYHASMVPMGEAITVRVRSLATDGEPRPWAHIEKTSAGQILLAVPDLIAEDVKPKPGEPPPRWWVPYSGRVVNEEGHPIENVQVRMTYEIPGHMSHGGKEAQTDTQGRWRVLLPRDLDRVSGVTFWHPEYLSGYITRPDSPSAADLRDGSAEIVMRGGHVLTGFVHDANNRPVADALVLTQGAHSQTGGLGEPIENSTMARSGADGRFRVGAVPSGPGKLAVYATGYAPRAIEVTVESGMPPVDIELREATSIRGQVVDPQGQPVAGARVTADDWKVKQNPWEPSRPLPLPRQATTDEQGRFELFDLPTEGSFAVRYGKRSAGFASTQTRDVKPREEPYRFTIYPPTVIEGQVVDSESGRPITKFKITQGTLAPETYTLSFDGQTQTVKSEDGSFRSELTRWIYTPPYPEFAVKIEAEGYEPSQTRTVKVGEMIEPLRIELKPKSSNAPDEGESARPAERRQMTAKGAPMDDTPAASTGPFPLQIKVVDPQGKPVTDCQALIHTHEHGYTWWRRSEGGTLRYTRTDVPGFGKADRFDVLIRAPGYAPAIVGFARPENQAIDKTITLESGRLVEMTIRSADGKPVPKELVPLVYFPDCLERVRMMRQPANKRPDRVFDFDLTLLETVEAGRYRFRLPTSPPEFYVSIDHPGVLISYDAGPFSAEDVIDDKLEIRLPKPAKLTVTFGPPDDLSGDLPYHGCNVWLARFVSPESSTAYGMGRSESEDSRLKAVFDDLPPGHYLASAYTVPAEKADAANPIVPNPGAFRDAENVTLEPGDVKTVHMTFKPYDPDAWRGEHSATLRILQGNGTPAAGKPFRILYSVENYGQITVREGTVPPDGRVRLTDVDDGRVEYDRPRGGRKHRDQFSCELAGEWIASFNLLDIAGNRELVLRRHVDQGDPAPDVTFTDLDSGQILDLSDLRGQVVFIEFWATWCGPCQTPMEKLNEIVRLHADGWKGKVTVLAVSVDDKPGIVDHHIRKRGWMAVKHLWCGEEYKGFDAMAARAFGLHGVPTALLIAPDGKIAWRGHPGQDFDLVTEIGRVLEAGHDR